MKVLVNVVNLEVEVEVDNKFAPLLNEDNAALEAELAIAIKEVLPTITTPIKDAGFDYVYSTDSKMLLEL